MPEAFSASGQPAPAGEPPFEDLAVGLFRAQFAANPAYQAICRVRGIVPEQLTDWREIPAVPTRAFKEFELTALPPEERRWVYHSSGTTGQTPSRHFHNVESRALYEASLIPWFQRHVLGDGLARRFFALTPPPAQVPHSSLAHMLAVGLQEFSGPTPGAFYGCVNALGTWELELERLFAALAEAEAASTPVLLLGTAFNFVHWLDELAATGRRLVLPPNSRLMETGGYKGRSRALPRAELHAELALRLGLPADQIITEYGMSELSSQAYAAVTAERPTPIFVFPPWARALVVSPETGREVAVGAPGHLRVFDLANVWSVLAVQTEDLAIRRDSGFELLGRLPAAEPRGCSLMTT
jgi:hypothetical protein